MGSKSENNTLADTENNVAWTPYESTIFYHENKFHERMIAALANRAQTIPIDNADMAAIAAAPQHLSPDVFVFADIAASTAAELLSRGFQRIYVLDGSAEYPFGCKRFEWNDVHLIRFIPGVLSIRVVEMALVSAIPGYKSMIDDLRPDDGQNLYDGLMSLNIPLEVSLVKMCEGYTGFDQCIAMISRGKTLRDHRAYIARMRFEQAIIYQHQRGKQTEQTGESYLIGLVCAPDFNPDFLRQKIPGVSLTVMWNFICAPSAGSTSAQPNGFAILDGIPKPAHCEYYYHVRVTYADRADAVAFLKKFSNDISHVNAVTPYFSAKIRPEKFHQLLPTTN